MNVPSHSDSMLLERRKAALTAVSPIELLFSLSHLRHGECLVLSQKGILEAYLSLAHLPQLIAQGFMAGFSTSNDILNPAPVVRDRIEFAGGQSAFFLLLLRCLLESERLIHFFHLKTFVPLCIE